MKYKQIELADDTIMDSFFETELYKDFCEKVLEYNPDDVLLTDESTLGDFPEEIVLYRDRVRVIFGVDISDIKPSYISKILQRINNQKD